MTCRLCGGEFDSTVLDLGGHPVSNRFAADPEEAVERYDLTLGQCSACRVVQLLQPLPHTALVPPFRLFFNEPEEHLNSVVDELIATCGLNDTTVVNALTYKDDTTLDRLEKRGVRRGRRFDMQADFEVPDESGNIESIQAYATPERARALAERYGQADLLLARHIFEHAESTSAFAQALGELVREGGYVMIEVPDCRPNMLRRDYTMVWEEHAFYPTPYTMCNLLQLGGFTDVAQRVYPMAFENCIVIVARKDRAPQWPEIAPEAARDAGLLEGYARDYEPTKQAVRSHLRGLHDAGERIAMFGAGHLCCAFVYYYDVADLIHCVADDTPSKQGQYLPGTRIPIVPGERLVEDGIGTSILAVSVHTEPKILKAKQAFLDAGGKMRSAFRASERSIFKDIPDAPQGDF
jgi:hypothetical protein